MTKRMHKIRTKTRFFAQCKRQCKRSIAHVLGRPVLRICGSGCHYSTWSRSIWHAKWVIKQGQNTELRGFGWIQTLYNKMLHELPCAMLTSGSSGGRLELPWKETRVMQSSSDFFQLRLRQIAAFLVPCPQLFQAEQKGHLFTSKLVAPRRSNFFRSGTCVPLANTLMVGLLLSLPSSPPLLLRGASFVAASGLAAFCSSSAILFFSASSCPLLWYWALRASSAILRPFLSASALVSCSLLTASVLRACYCCFLHTLRGQLFTFKDVLHISTIVNMEDCGQNDFFHTSIYVNDCGTNFHLRRCPPDLHNF